MFFFPSTARMTGGRSAVVARHHTADSPPTADIIALRTFPTRAGSTSIFLASAKHHLIARFVLAKMGRVYTVAADGGDNSLYPPSSLNLPKFSKKEGLK